MVNLLCGDRVRDKVIYTRHIYYTDYTRLGCDIKYFNMVGYHYFVYQILLMMTSLR